MKRWVRRLFLYAFLVVFFMGGMMVMSFLSGGTNTDAEEPQPAPAAPLKRVDVAQISPQHFEESIIVPGMVEAEDDVTLGAVIPGVVEKIFVKEGDRVQKGQVLFQIDLRARQARLEEMTATHEMAQKKLDRITKLHARGDVTKQEYDDAVGQSDQSAAALRWAEVELSLGKVESSIDGVVDKVYVEEGEYMPEGKSLARLMNLDRLEVKAGIPERYTEAVNRERKAAVVIDALNERRDASVERVAFGGDPGTNTYETTIVLPNPGHRIRPGMIVRVEFVTRSAADAVMVPVFSVVRSEKGMIVYVEKDGVVEERVVTLGNMKADAVEVVAGIAAGENVVVTGQKDLIDGQEVEVVKRIEQLAAAQ